MAEIIHEYIVSRTGDWGKPGRNYCTKCKRPVETGYKFCPWCGEIFTAIKVVEIVKDGGMWDAY